MWFDMWEGIKDVPIDKRPFKITFGDDSELAWEEKKLIVDLYDKYGIHTGLNEVGDIAIVCNYRFAHGRPAINLEEGEKRELGVILGQKFDRQGAIEGKW
mmetsp:Transcript_106320/g.159032  ORF Transcript_106320/g.159032 Transcript_106320/m.159032 type:complete len:100 (+) Transcript_106320:188-487(+)